MGQGSEVFRRASGLIARDPEKSPMKRRQFLRLAATAAAPRVMQIYGTVLFAALALYVAIAAELWRVKRASDSVVR